MVPKLTITVDGVHDVGRMLAVLAKGNVEHAQEAHDAATTLRQTRDGRDTLAYLESHGGPRLGNDINARCPECLWEQYVSEEYLPINCPKCPYGQLALVDGPMIEQPGSIWKREAADV